MGCKVNIMNLTRMYVKERETIEGQITNKSQEIGLGGIW